MAAAGSVIAQMRGVTARFLAVWLIAAFALGNAFAQRVLGALIEGRMAAMASAKLVAKPELGAAMKRWERFAREKGLPLERLLADKQAFLAATVLDHEFVRSWFGEETTRNLVAQFPEYKRMSKDLHLPLAEVMARHPGAYPAIPIALFHLAPQRYANLLLFSSERHSLTLGELNDHVRGLMARQLDNEFDALARVAGAQPIATRDPVPGDVTGLLATVQADPDLRRRNALQLLGVWSAPDKDSITGAIRASDMSLERQYQKAPTAPRSGVLALMRGLYASVREKFEGTHAPWAPDRGRTTTDPQRTVAGRITVEGPAGGMTVGRTVEPIRPSRGR